MTVSMEEARNIQSELLERGALLKDNGSVSCKEESEKLSSEKSCCYNDHEHNVLWLLILSI